MFSLTIVFGPSPVPWVLLFRSEEAMVDAHIKLEQGTLTEDSFGQKVHIKNTATIHGIMMEDMDQSALAHVEQSLHRARTQAKANTMARSDKVLQAAAMVDGAPMLQPGFGGPNGAFRGQ